MATRRRKSWLCTRKRDGVKCMTRNEALKQKCVTCGAARPKRSTPKHMTALKVHDYEFFVELNGGEHCGICGRGPSPTRRLDRDHAHTIRGLGEPRGLLCPTHNRWLPSWMTLELARAMVAYLERHEVRMGRMEGEEAAR